MNTSRLVLVLAVALAACASEPSSRVPEEEQEPDQPRCDRLKSQLRVLEERASCETDAECSVLGSCEDSDWRVVATRDQVEGKRLHAEISEACGSMADGPLPHAECVQGQCALIGATFETATEFCGQVPPIDAGDDAGDEDAGR